MLNVAAESSLSSSSETLSKIELAAEKNEDPEVATVLEDAAIAADTTKTRVGWLRSILKRLRREPVA
jgi:hypothetical protein